MVREPRLFAVLVAAMILGGVSGANAQVSPCVANLLSGLTAPPQNCGVYTVRPVKVVFHQTGWDFVAYASAEFYKAVNGTHEAGLSFQFSDRWNTLGGNANRFNIHARDSGFFRVNPASGQVQFGIYSWGFSTPWMNPTCSGSVITAHNGVDFFSVTVGATQSATCYL